MLPKIPRAVMQVITISSWNSTQNIEVNSFSAVVAAWTKIQLVRKAEQLSFVKFVKKS